MLSAYIRTNVGSESLLSSTSVASLLASVRLISIILGSIMKAKFERHAARKRKPTFDLKNDFVNTVEKKTHQIFHCTYICFFSPKSTHADQKYAKFFPFQKRRILPYIGNILAIVGFGIFCLFSYQYVSDFFEGKLITIYEQIPRSDAERAKIWPKFAICVPYNGLYFSVSELGTSKLKNVRQKFKIFVFKGL